jgi:hypothetical protein
MERNNQQDIFSEGYRIVSVEDIGTLFQVKIKSTSQFNICRECSSLSNIIYNPIIDGFTTYQF